MNSRPLNIHSNAFSIKAANEHRKRVAEWIANNRRVLGLSVEQLGVAIDRSPSTIRNWENGIGRIALFDALALRIIFCAKWAEYGKRHIITPEEIAVRDLPLPQLPISMAEA